MKFFCLICRRGVGMCGIGEMILLVKCRHIDGTTSAPYTTTTTESTPKAECDMSGFFHGYPLTASNMHLSVTTNGVNYSSKVLRETFKFKKGKNDLSLWGLTGSQDREHSEQNWLISFNQGKINAIN